MLRRRPWCWQLHGFNDSRDAWAIPAPVFAASGIAVFCARPARLWRHHRPRHLAGRGDPVAERCGGFDGAAACTSRYPAARLYVMGESMGGAVADGPGGPAGWAARGWLCAGVPGGVGAVRAGNVVLSQHAVGGR